MFTKLKALASHHGFHRYLKNTSWLMLEQMLRILAGLFVGIWVARYLGPEEFGVLSYVLAFSAIFGGIAKLGLDGIMVRELVRYPERTAAYLGTAFWLKVIGAIMVLALIAVIVPFTSNDVRTNLYIYIIAIGLIVQSFEVIEFYFQSQVLAKLISVCKVIQLTFSSLIKIYLVLAQADLSWFVLVTFVDMLTLAISYSIAYRIQKNTSFYRFFDKSIATQLLTDSWPLILSSIVVMIYMRIDQVMIKEMLGEYEVGIYSAAIRLSEAFYFIPTLITASLFPAILNAKKINEKLYAQRLQRLYTLIVWLATFLALVMTVLSDWIVTNTFGPSYQESAAVLIVLIWCNVFAGLLVISGKWYISENLTKLALYRNLLAVVFNVALNLVLIRPLGIKGAALASLVAMVISAYFFDAMLLRTREQFYMKTNAFLLKGFRK